MISCRHPDPAKAFRRSALTLLRHGADLDVRRVRAVVSSSCSGATGVPRRVKIASLRVREIDRVRIAQYQIDQRRCPRTSTSWSRATTSTRRAGRSVEADHSVQVRRRRTTRASFLPGRTASSGPPTTSRTSADGRPAAVRAPPRRRRRRRWPSEVGASARRPGRAARRGAACSLRARRHDSSSCPNSAQIKTARASHLTGVNGLRQLATTPAETVPNQDGTAAAEAALSPGSARVGWPANRRRAQTERPRARRLACQQTSARPAHPVLVTLRADRGLPSLRSENVFPVLRRALARSNRNTFSRASFLGTDRSRPPRRRGERPPVPCAEGFRASLDAAQKQSIGRRTIAVGCRPTVTMLARCGRPARSAGAGLRAAELSEASAGAGGRRSV